jgi:hypothetical protein
VIPIEFESVVLEAFGYLIDSFGFRYLSTHIHSPECWSTFHNSTTAVTVHFELGSQPWVELAELKRDGGCIFEQNRVALEFLVKERAPQETALITNESDEQTKAAIREKARQLRAYAEDVLKGDFRIFPRLMDIANDNLRRRNATEG